MSNRQQDVVSCLLGISTVVIVVGFGVGAAARDVNTPTINSDEDYNSLFDRIDREDTQKQQDSDVQQRRVPDDEHDERSGYYFDSPVQKYDDQLHAKSDGNNAAVGQEADVIAARASSSIPPIEDSFLSSSLGTGVRHIIQGVTEVFDYLTFSDVLQRHYGYHHHTSSSPSSSSSNRSIATKWPLAVRLPLYAAGGVAAVTAAPFVIFMTSLLTMAVCGYVMASRIRSRSTSDLVKFSSCTGTTSSHRARRQQRHRQV